MRIIRALLWIENRRPYDRYAICIAYSAKMKNGYRCFMEKGQLMSYQFDYILQGYWVNDITREILRLTFLKTKKNYLLWTFCFQRIPKKIIENKKQIFGEEKNRWSIYNFLITMTAESSKYFKWYLCFKCLRNFNVSYFFFKLKLLFLSLFSSC